MPLDMSAYLLDRPARLLLAIATDNEMISDHVEAALPMPTIDLCRTNIHVGLRRAAVNNDQVNFSHGFMLHNAASAARRRFS